MSAQALMRALGDEILDPEEAYGTVIRAEGFREASRELARERLSKTCDSELSNKKQAFLLFSQSIPSQNLGFVDSKATLLELTVGGRDLSILQSPTVLASNRGGGTTGAVVWKVTPLFASWLASSASPFSEHNILSINSTILELGCGISGIIGLAVSPLVKSYILTDQDYVMKLLNQNIANNQQGDRTLVKGRKISAKTKKGSAAPLAKNHGNIAARPLDWETDEVTPSLTGSDSTQSFDAVIACDCIYNDMLIAPLVQTCIDTCRLRLEDLSSEEPSICIVAQQLRSSEVFEDWLTAFHQAFHVWRLPDEKLIDGLKSDSGFVIHVGVLR